jgi:dihydrolipoamide dehydrogenase
LEKKVTKKDGKKIVVIGGGPGGYPAAIKAAQLGADVTLIDKGGVGGTCLHRGCIPTKFLLKSAKDYTHFLQYTKEAGLGASILAPDLALVMQKKKKIVEQLNQGTISLLKTNGVKVVSGTASFENPGTVRVLESGEELNASAFIIATGSESVQLTIEGSDLPGVLNSDQILQLETLPKSLVIIGGGNIGLEFAQIFSSLGTEVTIIEMLPRILPLEEKEISTEISKILSSSGINVFTDSKVSEIKKPKKQLRISFSQGKKDSKVTAEKVLMAVGRRPYYPKLGIDKIGLRVDKNGAIEVNDVLETSQPGIYALGDVVGGMMLAHKATAEGEFVAQKIMGTLQDKPFKVVPSVTYTTPEIASAGLSEDEAKSRYGKVLVGRFPFFANGRAVLEGVHQGFVKVIADAETECLVGTSMIGPQAGHLIGEAALAIEMESTLGDIAETVHAHPTLSEAFREAVLDAKGEAIHMPPRKVAN